MVKLWKKESWKLSSTLTLWLLAGFTPLAYPISQHLKQTPTGMLHASAPACFQEGIWDSSKSYNLFSTSAVILKPTHTDVHTAWCVWCDLWIDSNWDRNKRACLSWGASDADCASIKDLSSLPGTHVRKPGMVDHVCHRSAGKAGADLCGSPSIQPHLSPDHWDCLQNYSRQHPGNNLRPLASTHLCTHLCTKKLFAWASNQGKLKLLGKVGPHKIPVASKFTVFQSILTLWKD